MFRPRFYCCYKNVSNVLGEESLSSWLFCNLYKTVVHMSMGLNHKIIPKACIDSSFYRMFVRLAAKQGTKLKKILVQSRNYFCTIKFLLYNRVFDCFDKRINIVFYTKVGITKMTS
jgi:hypothetical protein